MDRRPARWQRPPAGGGGWRGGGGPMRTGHLVVLLLIVAGVLMVGFSAPLIRLESVLAWFGYR